MRKLPQDLTRGLRTVGVAAVYYATAILGLSLAGDPSGSITAVWAPSGIALAALILWGWRMLPAIWIASLAANLTTGAGLAAPFIATGNSGEAAVAYLIAGRYLLPFRYPRDVVGLVAAASMGSAVAANVGTLALHLTGHLSADDWLQGWAVWFLGDATGILLVTPLIVTGYFFIRVRYLREIRWGEAIVTQGALVAISLYVTLSSQPYAFAVFLPVLWSAGRCPFKPLGAASSSVLAAAIFAIGTAAGRGPFASDDLTTALLGVQIFATALAVAAHLTTTYWQEDESRARRTLVEIENARRRIGA